MSFAEMSTTKIKLQEHSGHTTKATLKSSKDAVPISLAFAETSGSQHYQQMTIEPGCTIFEALEKSGWFEQFPELALWCEQVRDIDTPVAKQWHVGVFSQKQPLSYVLKPHDRIEIYRSLKLDPMGKRKKRAIKKRQS